MQTDARTAPRPAPRAVGDAVPDVSLRDATGAIVRLAELWGAVPHALVFVRHFG